MWTLKTLRILNWKLAAEVPAGGTEAIEVIDTIGLGKEIIMAIIMTKNEDIQVINPLNLRLSLVDRDFTEEDYEVLLALDRMAQLIDNAMGARPQRGATESELNELPTHVYKSVIAEDDDKNEVEKSEGDKVKELDADRNVCAICLENFVDGDVVTTTPCFHQFHKAV